MGGRRLVVGDRSRGGRRSAVSRGRLAVSGRYVTILTLKLSLVARLVETASIAYSELHAIFCGWLAACLWLVVQRQVVE